MIALERIVCSTSCSGGRIGTVENGNRLALFGRRVSDTSPNPLSSSNRHGSRSWRDSFGETRLTSTLTGLRLARQEGSQSLLTGCRAILQSRDRGARGSPVAGCHVFLTLKAPLT